MDMTNHVNGIVLGYDSMFYMAEMANGEGGRITRMGRDKKIEVLVDKSPSGRALQTSDDLAVRSDGTIYFSDPIISRGDYVSTLGSLAQHPYYWVKPKNDLRTREIVRVGSASLPNGVRLSPDERTLYIAAFFDSRILMFDVMPDGSLSEPTTFASGLSSADSMCLDVTGNVDVGVGPGLQVLRPDGSKVKVIPIDARATTNCGFGGPDGKALVHHGLDGGGAGGERADPRLGLVEEPTHALRVTKRRKPSEPEPEPED